MRAQPLHKQASIAYALQSPIPLAAGAYIGGALLTLLVARLAFGPAVGLRAAITSGHVVAGLAVAAGLGAWVQGRLAPARFWQLVWALVLALALAAIVVTTTTPVNDMLDAFIRWITPLRRVGVDPDRVALTIGLAIQSLPGTVALAIETREAARARGLRHPRAYLTPFVIRVVARAHETGDALQARGIGDD